MPSCLQTNRFRSLLIDCSVRHHVIPDGHFVHRYYTWRRVLKACEHAKYTELAHQWTAQDLDVLLLFLRRARNHYDTKIFYSPIEKRKEISHFHHIHFCKIISPWLLKFSSRHAIHWISRHQSIQLIGFLIVVLLVFFPTTFKSFILWLNCWFKYFQFLLSPFSNPLIATWNSPALWLLFVSA